MGVEIFKAFMTIHPGAFLHVGVGRAGLTHSPLQFTPMFCYQVEVRTLCRQVIKSPLHPSIGIALSDIQLRAAPPTLYVRFLSQTEPHEVWRLPLQKVLVCSAQWASVYF